MRRRLFQGGVAAIAAAVAVIAATFPSQAAGGLEGTGDVLDPLLYNQTTQKTLPGKPGVYRAHPATDLISWDLSAGTAPNGEAALTASITVAGSVPTEGLITNNNSWLTSMYPGFNGVAYKVMFQNPRYQNNQMYALCQRLDGREVRDVPGHYLDGYRLMLVVYVQVTATGNVLAVPAWAYYNPAGGTTFWDLKSHPTMANRYSYSLSGNTVKVTVAQNPTSEDILCNGGTLRYTSFRQGDQITNVSAMTQQSQIVALPVKIETSKIHRDLGDLQAIGGFAFDADPSTLPTGGDSWDTYTLYNSLGDNIYDGPKCWTPTVGGTVPKNPLHDGSPCQIDNPTGPEYINSGVNFTF